MKHEQLGEAINFYCFPEFFLGEAIANSLLAGAPPMNDLYISLIENSCLSYDKQRRSKFLSS
jgi:hypothetical protein